jgi:DNA-binding transcriptional LysR family regulator
MHGEGVHVMQLRQIEYFLALCEELHFTRAARRCRVSQPSLTNAIMALEDEFGGHLFHRKPRVRLTALGEAVLPQLAMVQLSVERALDAAGDLRTQRSIDGTNISIEPSGTHNTAYVGPRPFHAGMPHLMETG